MNREELRAEIELVIKTAWDTGYYSNKDYRELNVKNLTNQLLALFPETLSAEEIYKVLSKEAKSENCGYGSRYVITDFVSLSKALAGKIPEAEEKEECKHDNWRIGNHWECRHCGKVTEPPKENKRIEELDISYMSQDTREARKINELIKEVNRLTKEG